MFLPEQCHTDKCLFCLLLFYACGFLIVAGNVDECSVKMDIDVPISVAYNCYSDREAIPRWMPFISSVKVSEQLHRLHSLN